MRMSLLFVVIYSFLLNSFLLKATTASSPPFVSAAECTSLSCTLNFDAVTYTGPSTSFISRGTLWCGFNNLFILSHLNITGYNGAFPGPTIRVKAGDTLTLNLNNNLEDINNVVKALNIMDLPNTTVSVSSLIVRNNLISFYGHSIHYRIFTFTAFTYRQM